MNEIFTPHYLILGANSRTGKALALYLSHHQIPYSLSDTTLNFFTHYAKEVSLLYPPLGVFDSPLQTFEQLEGISDIIIAPGVPMKLPLLEEARRRDIVVDSEIAFCMQILTKEKRLPFFIGITGSLGKSTTSLLTYSILKAGFPSKNVYLLGNFGTPLATYLDSLNKEDIVVLELSSYQLEDGEKYHLHMATLLNVTPNHLDRYPSLQDYQYAKEKIFHNQTGEDFAILNKSRKELEQIPPKIASKTIFVSSTYDEKSLFSYDTKGDLYKEGKLFIENKNLSLKNPHLLEDMITALAFTTLCHVEPEIQKSVLKEFKGLEHRSEWVCKIGDIQFINDSKATTPFAVIPNLQNESYGKIVLLLGGKNKDLDFSILKDHLSLVVAIVYYGKDGEAIEKALPFSPSIYEYSFAQAVTESYRLAKELKADTVLLSPGCTSFDQFTSYEERGRVFKSLLQNIG